MSASEKEIIEKIKQGYIDCFEFLVKKYTSPIASYIRQKTKNADDTQDILQNTFLKAYKAIERFDTNKSFYPYLFSIAKNEVVSFFRKKPNELPLNEEIEIPNLQKESPDIGLLIKNLKPPYREVIQLHLEGYSYREIAQKTKKPLNTVKTLIRRGKMQLKQAKI